MEKTAEKQDFLKTKKAVELAHYKMPRFDELISYPVFMHQLVAILDDYLSVFLVPGEEKLVTPTMINSYVRKKVISAPVNKEYNKKQLAYLLAIGILKQVLSITDIGKLLKMQEKQYPLEVAYNYFCAEIEDALKVAFGSRKLSEFKNAPKIVTNFAESFHSAVMAFANKIYVKQLIYFMEQNPEPAKV